MFCFFLDHFTRVFPFCGAATSLRWSRKLEWNVSWKQNLIKTILGKIVWSQILWYSIFLAIELALFSTVGTCRIVLFCAKKAPKQSLSKLFSIWTKLSSKCQSLPMNQILITFLFFRAIFRGLLLGRWVHWQFSCWKCLKNESFWATIQFSRNDWNLMFAQRFSRRVETTLQKFVSTDACKHYHRKSSWSRRSLTENFPARMQILYKLILLKSNQLPFLLSINLQWAHPRHQNLNHKLVSEYDIKYTISFVQFVW